jgi:hypothetical protein
MAASEVDICKLAQAKIGNTAFFNSFNDNTTEALVCSVEYPQVRDVTFELAKPQFAVKRVQPGLLAEVRTGWLYTYALAADYITLLGFTSELGRFIPWDMREEYDIEMASDDSGRVLLTNVESAEILYVRRVTDVTKWPALFTQAVVMGLAASLALSLKKDVNLAASLAESYDHAVGQSHGSSESQRLLRSYVPESTTLRSRE